MKGTNLKADSLNILPLCLCQAAYVGNKSKNGKDLIARQVRATVENSGGRFLQKMTKGDRNGVWVAQSVEVAVLKIKQVRERGMVCIRIRKLMARRNAVH